MQTFLEDLDLFYFEYICNNPLPQLNFEGHWYKKPTSTWGIVIGTVRYINNNSKVLCASLCKIRSTSSSKSIFHKVGFWKAKTEVGSSSPKYFLLFMGIQLQYIFMWLSPSSGMPLPRVGTYKSLRNPPVHSTFVRHGGIRGPIGG